MAKNHLPGLNEYGQKNNKQSEYLEKVILSAAQSGDTKKLHNALDKVDLNKVNFDLKQRYTECTPLLIAAENGHQEIVTDLLLLGCDATLTNAEGQTVLHVALPKIQQLILDAVNRPGASKPLLWQAAWQGNAIVVKKLLALNPKLNINCKNSEGLTPLLLVTRDLNLFDQVLVKNEVFSKNYNPTEVVAELLHKNVDCSIVDNEGQSALHYTAKHHGTNAKNIISLLARKESLDVDIRDSQDYSALHFASETGDGQIMLALLDNGADVNARGNLGRTPLHITASRGDDQTSGLLLEHGANVLVVDDLGFTPIDVAKGDELQVLLKDAWTEHSQRSINSRRINSAPNVPMKELEHLEIQDITHNYEEESTSRRSARKSLTRLKVRSHSEEQHNPVHSAALPRRTRSNSSGPTSRPHLDPVYDVTSTLSRGLIEPFKSSPTYPKDLPTNIKLRQNKTFNRDRSTEVAARPVAKVSILNIDLTGMEFQRQKSKSCSELPFSSHRVQKLPNQRTSTDSREDPLNNVLSLQGQSFSAISFSSFDTLPAITPDPPNTSEMRNSSKDTSTAPLSPQIVVSPAVNNLPVDHERDHHDNDILNRTFNSKDSSIFWFPLTKDNSAPKNESQDSKQAFFVDFNNLEVPVTKCSQCGTTMNIGEQSHGSLCFACHHESVEKNCFWVSFGGKDSKENEGTKSFDDRTFVGKERLGNAEAPEEYTIQDIQGNKGYTDKERQGNKGYTTQDNPICVNKVGDLYKRKRLVKSMSDDIANASIDKQKVSPLKNTLRPCKSYGDDGGYQGENVEHGERNEVEEHQKHDGYMEDREEQEDQCIDGQEHKGHNDQRERLLVGNPVEQQGYKDHVLIEDALEHNGYAGHQEPLVVVESRGEQECNAEELQPVRDGKEHDGYFGQQQQLRDRQDRIPVSNPKDQVVLSRDNKEAVGLLNVVPNSEVTSHEVVIVNPYPTPEPPKVPKVNVTSNCQCNRLASFERNHVLSGKRKGKAKRTGTKGKKGWKPSDDVKDQVKEPRKNSGKGKRKKKGKIGESSVVKEISVIQTNLRQNKETGDEETEKCDLVQEPGTTDVGAQSLPDRQSSPTHEKSSCLTPILETSPRCNFEPENSEMPAKIDENSEEAAIPDDKPSIPSSPEVSEGELKSWPERPEIVLADEVRDTCGNMDKGGTPGMCSSILKHPSDDSEIFMSVSNADENLEDIIQEILSETEPSGGNVIEIPNKVCDKNETLFRPTENVDNTYNYTNSSARDESVSSGNENVFIEHETRNTTGDISTDSCARETDSEYGMSDVTRATFNTDTLTKVSGLTSDNNTNSVSETSTTNRQSCSDTTYENVSSWLDGNHRDTMWTARILSSDSRNDTTNTDSSYGSSGSTPRAMLADISSDYSTLSDDTWNETPGKCTSDKVPGSGTSSKPGLVSLHEHWSTSSGTISIPGESSSTSSGTIPVPGESSSSSSQNIEGWEKPLSDQFTTDLVHSRLSKSSSSVRTASVSSEEEEIIWKKGNMLGKGAFGKVWLGLTNAGQMIAVKQVELITSNMKVAEKQYEKLQEEVGLLKSLRHENIVSFLGTCLDGGVVNIFMEFVPGGSIASILARFGPLDENVFQYYTKQIVLGVEYLHRNNVVHRDIKGGNIMLMPTGIIKLIDFGCAKRLYLNISRSEKDLLRSMKGTPYWMAPEVIAETGHGLKSDIWSIGCTVFEMATGKPPWSHLPPMPAILAIGKGSAPPELAETSSKDARDFVSCTMTREPDARWSAEELLLHPFLKHCDDQR